MKHLKTYKIFENIKDNSELIKKLDEYNVKNYIINEDGTIDVDGNVNLSFKKLTTLPFKFNKVTGGFYCNNNRLISLEGSPKEVGVNFNCANNNLKVLIGGPEYVGGRYYCAHNQLETLEGCAGDIGDYLDCRYNKLISLDCSSVINDDIYCENNGFEEEPEFFGICGGKIIWK